MHVTGTWCERPDPPSLEKCGLAISGSTREVEEGSLQPCSDGAALPLTRLRDHSRACADGVSHDMTPQVWG